MSRNSHSQLLYPHLLILYTCWPRVQSHFDTSSRPVYSFEDRCFFPFAPCLSSRDLRHDQVNSPVCCACTAWETRGKGWPWAALRWLWEGAASVAAGSFLEKREEKPPILWLPAPQEWKGLPHTEPCLTSHLNLTTFPLLSCFPLHYDHRVF